MDPAHLRKICLAFPGSYEDYPFGPETAVFKVRAHIAGGATHESRVFALSSLDAADFYVNLKCEPALAEQLRAAHPEITGAWHMNKTHWNGVRLDGALPDGMVGGHGGGFVRPGGGAVQPEAAGTAGLGRTCRWQ